MNIYIPSYDRAKLISTINHIPIRWRKKTFIVVRESQVNEYKKHNPNFQVLGCPIIGIAKTRQWILNMCPTRYCMMIDDDMKFGVRKNGGLKDCTKKDMNDMFNLLINWLEEGLVHVGVSQRFGNNWHEEEWLEIGRSDNVYAFNKKKMIKLEKKYNVGFHWLEEQNPKATVMENFIVQLQLLSLGYKNRVTYKYCWGQKKSGMEGGCSTYRTYEAQKESAFEIAKHFPNIATPVKKEAKVEWEGIGFKRWDLRIQWKKAFKSQNKKSIRSFLK